jgi:acyl-CoA thioester hydrolase
MHKLDITYRGTVQIWHCDHMGHMNVMWYVGKFDEATWNLAAMMGMSTQYLKSRNRGMAALDQRIAYKREALAGDVITIRSALLEVKPKIVRFVHEMTRTTDGTHLATMLVTAVHMDTSARKSVAFEPEIFAATQAMLAPDPAAWDTWPPQRAFIE